jgi:hypothetical protein
MRQVRVRAVHQAILQAERDTMAQQCIALHLPQADATMLLAALDWLASNGVDWSRAAHLRLVAHHVSAFRYSHQGQATAAAGDGEADSPEALIEDNTQEDVSLHELAGHSIIEGFGAIVAVAASPADKIIQVSLGCMQ